jgi:hypothetical protein
MNGYLGETPFDLSTHPEYKNYTPAQWALYFIGRYGQIEGDHHRCWVLDQAARILNGTPVVAVEAKWDNGHTELRISVADEPSQSYLNWVKEMKGPADENGETEYGYDEGIAP